MKVGFTICSNNYLAQAIVLGNSLLEYNPSYDFKICLADRKIPEINYASIPFEVIEMESIGMAAFDEMYKRYNIIELNTSVKPFCFNYFFKNEPEVELVFYLDPDIVVYSPFSEMESALIENEIVIIPHFTTPINDDKIQAENDFLNSGLYNLGFLALKKGEESQKLLEWWAKRLETKAYINLAKGMFTDQIWINFVPLFFDKVHILKHPGYNMAYWNMHERILSVNQEVVKNGNTYPLIFFHFSGFNPLIPDTLSKYQDRFSFQNRIDVVNLFKDYTKDLLENSYLEYVQYSCYYVTQKQNLDWNTYLNFKRSIPFYKRIIRGIVLRFIKLFNINIEYYIR
jgi:hypothetical protein